MSDIKPAASVLLYREPEGKETYLVKRSQKLRFFGGFWAFPGGKVSEDDARVPIREAEDNHRLNLKRAAAARELFEETGILLARQADGSFLQACPQFTKWRQGLHEGWLLFSHLLAELGLTLWPRDFLLIGNVTTPAFAPLRFETTFFVSPLPEGQQPEVWPGELDEGRWVSAADMLASWTRGECLLSPPTIMTLQAIAGRAVTEAPTRLGPLLASLEAGKLHPIYFAPAVQMIPLRTMGLPPSTHTNAYLAGNGPCYLIDPGPGEETEQQRLFDLLDEHARAGRRLAAVILSHHHPDHIGAANAVSRRYQVPIWAHPWTARNLEGKITVSRPIHDGERIDLGPCPEGEGGGPWRLEAVHTPGHAPGHLAFYEPHYRLLLAGDMVSTLSSVVIAPPEGDLSQYLASLRRLRSYDCRLLLPGHGNASARPRETLDDCLDHRAKREQQLVEVLAQGPRTIDDLAPELYKGLPANLMVFAKWQIEAGLIKLLKEGQVEKVGEKWVLTHRAG